MEVQFSSGRGDSAQTPGGLGANERWFVVNSKPKREMQAFMHLANQGFRLFMPKRRKTVRHARKTTVVLAPVFPSYIFVALDVTQPRWRSVNGTFGVLAYPRG